MLEHKSGNISDSHKDSRKVTIDAYRNLLTLFQKVPSPTT